MSNRKDLSNVSFCYPGAQKDSLRNVSFSIKPGQLCVIVGANGEGKSSIIKLINRVYDCTGGQILIDGKDIRSYRLADLHQSTSVLFQDYRHFPVSVSDFEYFLPVCRSSLGCIMDYCSR